MKISTLIVAAIFSLSLSSCLERVVEPEDVFGAIRRGETYSPASKMIDSWYAVEAIDAQTARSSREGWVVKTIGMMDVLTQERRHSLNNLRSYWPASRKRFASRQVG